MTIIMLDSMLCANIISTVYSRLHENLQYGKPSGGQAVINNSVARNASSTVDLKKLYVQEIIKLTLKELPAADLINS